MPELPEVETTRRGIAGNVVDIPVRGLAVRQASLRWPVDTRQLRTGIVGRAFTRIDRRGKYLLFGNARGWMICHLGMSGSMRIVTNGEPPRRHDHVEWLLDSGAVLRFHDPRRFGCVLWTSDDAGRHRLLAGLGPEPLSREFDAGYLYRRSRNRKQAVKTFIMDSRVVAGVGNIYASEALFDAGIHPSRAAGRVSGARYGLLVNAIRRVLEDAIASGGTTLRDFVNSRGQPGYFRQQLNVYEKAGKPCRRCGNPVRRIVQGQRATYYCPHCQH